MRADACTKNAAAVIPKSDGGGAQILRNASFVPRPNQVLFFSTSTPKKYGAMLQAPIFV